MGADLLLASLPIRDGQEPNWQAGHDWIDEASYDTIRRWIVDLYLEDRVDVPPLTDEEERAGLRIGDLDDEEFERREEAAIRQELHLIVKRVEASFDHRDVDWLTVPGWKIYVTGGMSWGDVPTDSYQAWQEFGQIMPMAIAAGFFWPNVLTAIEESFSNQ